MKKIIKNLREYKNFIIISTLSCLTIVFLLITLLFMSISNDLAHVVQEQENEIENQKNIASEYKKMWLEEKSTNEWLWDMYYSNMSSYDGEYKYYE